MAPHQSGSCPFLAPVYEALQQLPIGQTCPILQKRDLAEVLDNFVHLTSVVATGRSLILYPYSYGTGRFGRLFFARRQKTTKYPREVLSIMHLLLSLGCTPR